MYVIIGSKTYTEIRNLTFAPETDVTGSKVPVNEFIADVVTDDQITVGSRASLYDDLDTLWAKYWVIYAERPDKYTVRVKAQSAVKQLERDMLDPVMCNQTSLASLMATVMSRLNNEYTIDSSFSGETITGFLPKQTARNRLIWICLAIGAYVKDFFNDRLEVLPVPEGDEPVIPIEDVYWKPKVTYNEYVTAVRAVYYSYAQQTPSSTDDWVEANGTYYVQTETQVTLRNTSVPQIALEHVVTIEGITIVNEDNVDEILTHLSKYYFKRMQVDMDLIDNGDYIPGQRLIAPTDEDTLIVGYVTECSYSFGLQAKARMVMTPCEVKTSALLIITYKWGSIQVGVRRFRLPVGYEYEVQNQYITTTFNEHWYVFRPTTATVNGTIASGVNSVTQQVEVALDLYNGDLHIVSVDDVTLTDGTAVIS